MKRIWLLIAIVLLIVDGVMSSAVADRRLALLIGNQDYAVSVGPLKNPLNDISVVANALKAAGFETTIVTNAKRIPLLKAVDRFADQIGSAGTGTVSFFYYSGHGAARPSNRVNYLIPVDVTDMSDDNVWYMTVALDHILDALTQKAPEASHFVVFDACRNELHVSSDTKGSIDAKSFAPVNARSGQFIAFSTSPNQTASDTGETAGPYSIALASELQRAGQDHLAVFQNVRERVYEQTQTRKAQRPMEIGNLLRRVYFSGSGSPTRTNLPERNTIDVDQCLAALDTRDMSATDAIALYKKCLVRP